MLEYKPVPRPSAVSGRILIVDDDQHQRAVLAAMLAGSDLEIQMAGDGLEALERLAAFNADVIIADLSMPRMDGFELLRQLNDRGDLTPAIALTGFGSMEKALSAVRDLRAFWYLEKPVDPSAFKTLLERAIAYKRSLTEDRRAEARSDPARSTSYPVANDLRIAVHDWNRDDLQIQQLKWPADLAQFHLCDPAVLVVIVEYIFEYRPHNLCRLWLGIEWDPPAPGHALIG